MRNAIRNFFNGPVFLGLAAFATFVALMFGFITPNEQRDAFLHTRTAAGIGAAALVVFIIYLALLPRGALKRFFKSEWFVAVLAIAFTMYLTYLFITA